MEIATFPTYVPSRFYYFKEVHSRFAIPIDLVAVAEDSHYQNLDFLLEDVAKINTP
jgi:hypothetical protein